MKYLVIELDGVEDIFIFPRKVDHDRMAESCMYIKFGDGRNWDRKYHDGKVISAGFIDNGICHGRSESLSLPSRGDKDTALLNKFKE
jgi:hypothetical protein